MSDVALFIIGVSVFTVTLMAVLWTGYLVAADRFDADLASTKQTPPWSVRDTIEAPSSERIQRVGASRDVA